MSNTSFWKIFGWLAAVSICSAAVGAVAALWLQNVQNARVARTTSVGGLAEERLEKLREILHLNPEQEQAIAALLNRREKERGHACAEPYPKVAPRPVQPPRNARLYAPLFDAFTVS